MLYPLNLKGCLNDTPSAAEEERSEIMRDSSHYGFNEPPTIQLGVFILIFIIAIFIVGSI